MHQWSYQMAYPVLFFYSMHLLKVCALLCCEDFYNCLLISVFDICKFFVHVDNCILSET
jgi:hypothetical protein